MSAIFDSILTQRANAQRHAPLEYPQGNFDGPVFDGAADLPNELWAEISKHADFASSKQLRLVSKALNVFASKNIFREVYATALPYSLTNLRNIAHHASLSRHVKRLIYLMDRLDQSCTDLMQWENFARHASARGLSTDHKLKWQRFKELYGQQRRILKKGEELVCLKECVLLLPNLEDVMSIGSAFLVNEFMKGPQPILGPIFQETLLDSDYVLGGDIVERKHGNPHAALIRAFHKSGKSMKYLVLDDIPWEFWEDYEHRALFRSLENKVAVAFSNLRSLTLMSWMGTMGRLSDGPNNAIARFIAFLSAAPRLESLQMDFQPINLQGEEYSDEDDTELTDIFAQMSWPNLQELLISECRADHDAFVGFMARHTGTLRYLRLWGIALTGKVSSASINFPVLQGQPGYPQSCSSGACWEHAIKFLAPIMAQLSYVDLSGLDDEDLQQKSGGPLAYGSHLETEHYRFRNTWCAQVSAFMMFNGDWPFPVYGLGCDSECEKPPPKIMIDTDFEYSSDGFHTQLRDASDDFDEDANEVDEEVW